MWLLSHWPQVIVSSSVLTHISIFSWSIIDFYVRTFIISFIDFVTIYIVFYLHWVYLMYNLLFLYFSRYLVIIFLYIFLFQYYKNFGLGVCRISICSATHSFIATGKTGSEVNFSSPSLFISGANKTNCNPSSWSFPKVSISVRVWPHTKTCMCWFLFRRKVF